MRFFQLRGSERVQVLDWRRHWRELVRGVLPIFVVVASILFLVVYFWGGTAVQTYVSALVPHERIGLLSAKREAPLDLAFALPSPIEQVSAPLAWRWDAPMGSEQGAFTYNAQPFLTTRHLGDDLNGIGGQDSDLGDPAYAAADGLVIFAGWGSPGWGNVVSLLHRLPKGDLIQSFYGHLKDIDVAVGTQVRRGQQLGAVGKGDGRYLAHLHFEIRRLHSPTPGPGYGDSAQGRVSGETFIREHRHAPDDWLNAPPQSENEIRLEPEGVELKELETDSILPQK
ncbi:MAG: M23 family metallopeptidase [Verrucomicrobiales bacterium]|nr:M23 family metallopeptidase [Verrucomicrobiales bacterium]